jgi:Polyketide cyclase / dehydrase and lipid transport
MGRVTASIEVPGLASEAEALWYDARRWPAWVDGFGHVVDLSGAWPADGRRLWDARPGGRGRVLERVTAFEPRGGQTLAVEDARLRGTQRVVFAPGPERVTITLELEYELKERHALSWAVDLLAVRPELAGGLRRTLAAFARERRGDLECDDVVSR